MVELRWVGVYSNSFWLCLNGCGWVCGEVQVIISGLSNTTTNPKYHILLPGFRFSIRGHGEDIRLWIFARGVDRG